jgi:hypothetical protein
MAGRPLAVRDVEDEVEKDIVNCFEIVCDGKLYVFFAESQVQKAHWTAAIAYAIAAAERRLHPQMVAKATSGDIIMTVRSTWGTTQPKSRLGRQRREDAKMQLQQSLARQPSGLSRVSSSASSTAAAGTRPPQPPALAGIATPQRDETPTDRENRRKAMARHSLRGSFDVSHWTQIPAASHQRVRSQDLLGSFASHSGAESLALSFGLAASSPAAAADEQQQQGHTMAVHTMPPAVSPALRVPLHGSPSKADIGLPPDEPAEEESGADCTSLLT